VDGLFSFGLIGWLGLRRARLFSQAVPFILIFAVTFCAGSVSLSMTQMNLAADHPEMPLTLQRQFIELSHTPFVALARAAAGRGADLALILTLATGMAWLTLRLTERAFVEGTQHLAENVADAARTTGDGPFRPGVLELEVRKNLRLIVRTPMMLVQCVAQGLTPIGVAFVLGRDDPARAVAFFVVFIAGVAAGMFTIAAGTVEECDDLLRMAPRTVKLFRWGKMISGCFWPVALALAVGIGLLLAGHGREAVAVLFGGIPLALTASLVGETFAKPVKPGVRPKLLADPVMMIPLLGMQITSGLVAGATVLASSFSVLALVMGLTASYLLFVLAIGLAQLRKPLLGVGRES